MSIAGILMQDANNVREYSSRIQSKWVDGGGKYAVSAPPNLCEDHRHHNVQGDGNQQHTPRHGDRRHAERTPTSGANRNAMIRSFSATWLSVY